MMLPDKHDSSREPIDIKQLMDRDKVTMTKQTSKKVRQEINDWLKQVPYGIIIEHAVWDDDCVEIRQAGEPMAVKNVVGAVIHIKLRTSREMR